LKKSVLLRIKFEGQIILINVNNILTLSALFKNSHDKKYDKRYDHSNLF